MANQDPIMQEILTGVDGWSDDDDHVTFACPYPVGKGAEGYVVIAEQHSKSPQIGQPCSTYAAIKFPLARDDKGVVRVTDASIQRVRAEHDKRLRLGNLPHLGQPPRLRSMPKPALIVSGGASRHASINVLVTPIGLDRSGYTGPIDLQSVIPANGCWSTRELVNWSVVARALARALWAIHGRAWAHGDIKPENVVLYQGEGAWRDVNLIDFGRVHADFPEGIYSAHYAGGTPEYMRPERFVRTQGGDGRVTSLRPSTEDLYALGVLLVEVLLGTKKREELLERAEKEIAGVKGIDERSKRVVRAGHYAVMLRNSLAEELRVEQLEARRAAFELCEAFLLRAPAGSVANPTEAFARTPTVDTLREFLAAIDVRLLRLTIPGGSENTWILLAHLLEALGAPNVQRPLQQSRQKYVDKNQKSAQNDIQSCVELLRKGYGRAAADALEARLEAESVALSADGNPGTTQRAYEVAQALRLYCGVLKKRELDFAAAERMLAKFAVASGESNLTTPRGILGWWVTHLRDRNALHSWLENRRSRQDRTWNDQPEEPRDPRVAGEAGPMPVQTVDWAKARVCFGSPEDLTDKRESRKASTWACSLALDWNLAMNRQTSEEEIANFESHRDGSEAAYEGAYGSLQLARAHANNAIVFGQLWSLDRILSELSLSVGWALVDSLQHEYAASLVVAAVIARRAFRSEAVAPALRQWGLDRDEYLVAAAKCALIAAAIYAELDVPRQAWRARRLAASCYSNCSSPEHQIEAIRWLNFARNELLLGRKESDPEREDLATSDGAINRACDAWTRSAGVIVRGTQGDDPGAFLGRAWFNRYGVGIEAFTDGALAVELAKRGTPDQTGPGEALKMALKELNDRHSPFDDALVRSFLDLDCGLGHDCIAAASYRRGPQFSRVFGIDSMEWCVTRAKDASVQSKAGFSISREDFAQASWGKRESDDRAFPRYDVIWAHDAFVHVSRRRRALANIFDRLLEGGALLMTDWVQLKPMSHERWRTLSEAFWTTGFETPEGYRRLLTSVGFHGHADVLDRTEHMNAFIKRVRDKIRNVECGAVTNIGDRRPSEQAVDDPDDDASCDRAGAADPSALKRAWSLVDTLQSCVQQGELGWVLVIAIRKDREVVRPAPIGTVPQSPVSTRR